MSLVLKILKREHITQLRINFLHVFHFAAGKTPRDLKNFDDLSDVCIYEVLKKNYVFSQFN